MTFPILTGPMAVTVRQCVSCKKIVDWPIHDQDWPHVNAYAYLHCGRPTQFISIVHFDRDSVCCEGDSEVGTAG